jgi:hypothetical protein
MGEKVSCSYHAKFICCRFILLDQYFNNDFGIIDIDVMLINIFRIKI